MTFGRKYHLVISSQVVIQYKVNMGLTIGLDLLQFKPLSLSLRQCGTLITIINVYCMLHVFILLHSYKLKARTEARNESPRIPFTVSDIVHCLSSKNKTSSNMTSLTACDASHSWKETDQTNRQTCTHPHTHNLGV